MTRKYLILLLLSLGLQGAGVAGVSYIAFPAGSSADSSLAVARDSNGFLYIAGTTPATDLPTTDASAQKTSGGDRDVFVLKINPSDNSVVYATYLGGSGADQLKAMVLGPGNTVYLAGVTASSNFPVTSGARQSALAGPTDAFVVKLDPSVEGSSGRVYSTFLGGTGPDGALALAVDGQGNAYITGNTNSNDFPIVGDLLPESNGGGGDAFISEFDPAGALVYSVYYGGERSETGRAIAFDQNGAVFIAGLTTSDFLPLAGEPWRAGSSGRGDAFVAKVIPSRGPAALVWATYLGGADLDLATRVAILPDGRVAVAGYTLSADFPVTQGAYQSGYRGQTDAFVSVLDPAGGSGGLLYSTYFGGNSGDVPYDLRAGADGTLTFAGYTLSPDFPVTGSPFQGFFQGGGADGFIATLDPARTGADALLYSSFLGGPGTDVIYGLDLGDSGTLYATGVTASAHFPSDGGGGAALPGRNSAFVLALSK